MFSSTASSGYGVCGLKIKGEMVSSTVVFILFSLICNCILHILCLFDAPYSYRTSECFDMEEKEVARWTARKYDGG